MFKTIIIFGVNEQGGPLALFTGRLKRKMFGIYFSGNRIYTTANNG